MRYGPRWEPCSRRMRWAPSMAEFTPIAAIPALPSYAMLRAPRLTRGAVRRRLDGASRGPHRVSRPQPGAPGSEAGWVLTGAVPGKFDAVLGADVSLPLPIPSQASAPSSLPAANPRGRSLRGKTCSRPPKRGSERGWSTIVPAPSRPGTMCCRGAGPASSFPPSPDAWRAHS